MWERARVRVTYVGALILTFPRREKEKSSVSTKIYSLI
jgi:hypothetical protein